MTRHSLPRARSGLLPDAEATLVRIRDHLTADLGGATGRSGLRPVPPGEQQLDFFVPAVYDVPVKDGLDLMDVAVFRLSKGQPRKGEIISYTLPSAFVEVSGGAHGMATVYDYDLVLLMVSHLAERVRAYRRCAGPPPSKKVRLPAAEVFRFCRLPNGGQQYVGLEAAIDRLQGTHIKITARGHASERRTGYFPLLAGAEVVSRTDTGRVGTLELTAPDWLYDAVAAGLKPDILTVHPDYFRIDSGLGRFLYRLSRKAAGRTDATYSVRTLYERSGSTRAYRKFLFDLRKLVARDDLPDYRYRILQGATDPLLHIQRRSGSTDPTGTP